MIILKRCHYVLQDGLLHRVITPLADVPGTVILQAIVLQTTRMCVRACVRACVCVCVRLCVCACER